MGENSMEQKKWWKKRYREQKLESSSWGKKDQRKELRCTDDEEEKSGKRMEKKKVSVMWQKKEKSLFLIHKANAWSWGDQGTTPEILGNRKWLIIGCKMELNFFSFWLFPFFCLYSDCKEKFTRSIFRSQPLGWQQRNNTQAFIPQTGGEVLWWPLASGH